MACLLPTTVIGSYSMPAWLGRAKNDYLQRKLSQHDLHEMYAAARKAAIKDQEIAGIDVVSDGELQRDNMIDHFAERLAGVHVDFRSKRLYYDLYQCAVRSRLATASLGLAEEVHFLRKHSSRPFKISITGPHALTKRIRNEHYETEEQFALDLARIMNVELHELVRLGATNLQIDEPYYSGFPEDLEWAVRAINIMTAGLTANLTLHVCYGNRYGKPSFDGSYHFLFPHVLEARVHVLSLEFARRGDDDLRLFEECRVPFTLAVGVIDVKSHDVESPGLVAERLRRALRLLPPDRIVVTPDCGLVHLPQDVAFQKLSSMAEGTQLVRHELGS